MPLNIDKEDADDFDTRHYGDEGDGYEEPSEAIITATKVFKQANQTTLSRKARQSALARTVDAVGWLDSMKNDDPIRIPTRLNIDEDKSANQWKQLLTDKRQGILDEREIQADKKEKSKNFKPPNKDANKVKVVDRKYFLSKNFKASNAEAQKLIDDTAKKFSLNKAQERAFRTVANHAVESNGEQLKMYLG